MKDDKLNEQFNGYFEGLNTPDASITEDAKKFVTKPSVLPRLAKIASIAASVVVCVTAAVLVTVNLAPAVDGGGTAPPSSTAPDPDNISYYGESELTTTGVNAYAASAVDPSLKFLERLSFSPSASVTVNRSDFENGELALVRAQAAVVRQARYDAEIYVEYTEKVYLPLSEYADGEKGYYGGIEYRLTRETADNGEPVNKLLVEKDGVKYYFNVQSSDTNSYLMCLKLLGF